MFWPHQIKIRDNLLEKLCYMSLAAHGGPTPGEPAPSAGSDAAITASAVETW